MSNFKKLPQNGHEGKIIYNNKIVEDIVLLAVSELEYVELNKISKNNSSAIKVEFSKDGVIVDVAVKINFTQSVSDVAFKIQESIRHNVESMTEFHIASVNVSVNGIMFDDIAQKQISDEQ